MLLSVKWTIDVACSHLHLSSDSLPPEFMMQSDYAYCAMHRRGCDISCTIHMRGQERFAHTFVNKTVKHRRTFKSQHGALQRIRVAAAPKDEVEVSYTGAAFARRLPSDVLPM